MITVRISTMLRRLIALIVLPTPLDGQQVTATAEMSSSSSREDGEKFIERWRQYAAEAHYNFDVDESVTK